MFGGQSRYLAPCGVRGNYTLKPSNPFSSHSRFYFSSHTARWLDECKSGIEKIIEAERKVAEYYGIKVCDLYKDCQELNNFSGNVATYRIGDSDDIHPNNLGHEAQSVLIQKSLEDMFL